MYDSYLISDLTIELIQFPNLGCGCVHYREVRLSIIECSLMEVICWFDVPTKNILYESCKNVQDLFQNLVKPYDSQESWMILARSCKLQ